MVLKGRIAYGKQLGRTIGYPTANLDVDELPEAMPENGVYAAWFFLEDGARRLPCVLNQGRHPTVPEGEPTIEAHILDFDEDIYGCQAAVEYLRFLRPEAKFASLDALKAQIGRDEAAARAYFRRLGARER